MSEIIHRPEITSFPSRITRLAASLLLTTAVSLTGCKQPSTPDHQEKESVDLDKKGMSKSSLEPPASGIANPSPENLDEAIKLPEMKFLNREMTFPKPPEITASDEDYRMASVHFANQVSWEFIPKLEQSFVKFPEAKMDPEQRGKLMLKFMNAIVNFAAADPVLFPCFENFKGQSPDIKDMAIVLKPIFLHGGLYFDLHYTKYEGETNKAIIQMMVYKVQSTESAEMSDDKTTVEIPVLTLGDRVFDLDEYSSPGLQDTDMNLALVFGQSNRPQEKINKFITHGIIKDRPED